MLPRIFDVEVRWRWLAVASAGMFALAVAGWVALQVHDVYANRLSPPTQTSMIDGRAKRGSLHDWGQVGSIVMLSEWPDSNVTVAFGDKWDTSLDKWKEGFVSMVGGSVDPPASVERYLCPDPDKPGNLSMVVLNLSALQPNFGPYAQHVVQPRVPVTLRFRKNYGLFNIYTVPPATTLDDLLSLDFRSSREHDHPALFQSAPWFRETGHIHYSVRKAFVPAGGIFWGWPWEGDHTTPRYHLTPMSVQSWGSKSNAELMFMTFVFNEPVIQCLQPIGLLSQLFRVILSVGSLIPLYSTAFYFIFVRRYKRTHAEDKQLALTLLGSSLLATDEAQEDEKASSSTDDS